MFRDGKELSLDEKLYVKRGTGGSTRYYPVARFDGFPSDGIWMVNSQDGGKCSTRVLGKSRLDVDKVGPLPERYIETRVALERRKDEATRALDELFNSERVKQNGVSNNDIVNALFDMLASKPSERGGAF